MEQLEFDDTVKAFVAAREEAISAADEYANFVGEGEDIWGDYIGTPNEPTIKSKYESYAHYRAALTALEDYRTRAHHLLFAARSAHSKASKLGQRIKFGVGHEILICSGEFTVTWARWNTEDRLYVGPALPDDMFPTRLDMFELRETA